MREIKRESFPVTGRANKAVEAGEAGAHWECLWLVGLLSKHCTLSSKKARGLQRRGVCATLYCVFTTIDFTIDVKQSCKTFCCG